MDYQRIIEEEASKNGVRVHYHNRGAQWGRAALESKTIYIPKPSRFPSFYTGLHELGPILSGHGSGDKKPGYLWEYEAFDWALKFCKSRGIQVPDKTVNYERNIVAAKIREAVSRGAKRIHGEVARFVRQGEDDDPDVAFVRKFVMEDGMVSEIRE